MKRILVAAALVAAIAACGGSDPVAPITKPKPDPYVMIRVQNQLDTTTKAGRAFWRVYLLLSGPQSNQNGIAPQGTYSLADTRLGHTLMCMEVGADSIGQRFIAPFALGDTIHPQGQPTAATDSIVTRWFNGDHTLPSGFIVLTMPPTDAWTSLQFAAGHGLTLADPIRWDWNLTGAGVPTFTERSDTASYCSKF